MEEVSENQAPGPKRAPRGSKVQHVYKALWEILKSLSVEKGGVLPSNMGGKPYITAVDLNSEAKRKFVDNNLVFLPAERQVSKEIINDNGRKTVAISIEGTYTIFSTEDGSSVQIVGVGDGIATGTAVSSNIASTNALKNALLRTFLVTEQSVEDAAKDGIADAPVNRDLAKAAAAPVQTVVLNSASQQILDLRAEIKRLGDVTNSDWASIGNALAKGKVWASDVGILSQVVERLKETLADSVDVATGEVAD